MQTRTVFSALVLALALLAAPLGAKTLDLTTATVPELEDKPYYMDPDWDRGAAAFPPPAGGTIPTNESVFALAFRDGLIQLHWLAIGIPLIVARYLSK